MHFRLEEIKDAANINQMSWDETPVKYQDQGNKLAHKTPHPKTKKFDMNNDDLLDFDKINEKYPGKNSNSNNKNPIDTKGYFGSHLNLTSASALALNHMNR